MSTIPTVTIRPSDAAAAYARTARETAPAATATQGTQQAGSFGNTVQQALQQAVDTGHDAEDKTTQALKGGGNLTDVVLALSHASMTLQTATAIRDRVVQAYQDIMKMPI
ncbi:flagellar hook-basal body complex protein FliE [Rhodopila sp.]|uniref:flagellar hook-basal body complex protein FliE n=1 Tax=Rhodopila sp. TaxID=2480087 RepID=UPI002BC6E751|nr:flagellar hook-basal body complex protein FliE [Rhodopila sp.]HVZ09053.1 flagellar hook-basal body complex protein FliE [Rhodopila sp.]